MSYIAPAYLSGANSRENSFHCPHCQTFAFQRWYNPFKDWNKEIVRECRVSTCDCCSKDSIWMNGQLIFPIVKLCVPPNPDLPKDCFADYEEARAIVAVSPKGAGALLRLCLQKLMVHLGQKGKNINDDISNLVKDGLPVAIQQALDLCRVIGNNAVHPGEIALDEDPKIVHSLFDLINFIVDNRITQPKRIDEMYSNLPVGAINAIEKRDSK
ncbi:DUF4145 domain-containing protein [Franconibacter daqui]|uniref:DUF4145 domain-containing protein n=1 Tax=Franconibacter daqui TaxID=2047724 RepID=UPI0030D0E319